MCLYVIVCAHINKCIQIAKGSREVPTPPLAMPMLHCMPLLQYDNSSGITQRDNLYYQGLEIVMAKSKV